jgi:hypothetical protein
VVGEIASYDQDLDVSVQQPSVNRRKRAVVTRRGNKVGVQIGKKGNTHEISTPPLLT